jgi:hypothetical protein
MARARLARQEIENVALEGTATSPDGLDKDGGSGGDQAAIDGNPDTYWDEINDQDRYCLKVSFAQPKAVSAVTLSGYRHHDYAPKNFSILCDGEAVASVKDAVYSNNFLLVEFPRVTCKTLALEITEYYGASPAIRELGIYTALFEMRDIK